MRTRLCVAVVSFCIFACYWTMAFQPGIALVFAAAAVGWGVMLGSEIQREYPGLWAWVADHIIARALRTPYFHLDGYMLRWWFLRLGHRRADNQRGDEDYPIVGARVHHILRSDVGPFHDHPWPYLTVILHGGYVEVRPVLDRRGREVGVRRHWYGPGSIIVRRAASWHLLEVPAGHTTWTLFCIGPKRQSWGFLVDGTKVPWREHLGIHRVRPPAREA